MNKVFGFFLILIVPLCGFSQAQLSLSQPRLTLSDKKLTIEYDIVNSESSDIFMVWVEIVDSRGNHINAISLSGDFGAEIKGGMDKRIIWDMGKDNIQINEEISVEVKAEKQIPPEKITESKPEKATEKSVKTITKTNMVLSSLVLPGWGQSKITKRKPYWLMGVASYGCLVASVSLNRKASATYDDYLNSTNITESDELYNLAVEQSNASKFFGYTAFSIWAANMIWVMVSHPPSDNATVTNKKFSIEPSMDPNSGTTMFTFRYRF